MKYLALLALASGLSFAADVAEPPQAKIEEIIQKFAANEAAFSKAREVYTYRQSARILDLDQSGATLGKWEMVSDIVFSQEGKRTEKVVRAPVGSLKSFVMTPEDLQDMQDVQPFVLTTAELPKYFIRYLGRQKIDEIDCYVFAVKPKTVEGKQRYFTGQVWVDDRDLLIVKSYGRAWGVANEKKKNVSPKFETFREQIDGKYWFPTYTVANDTLNFPDGQTARIRQTIRYEDYKQFGAESKITFGDEAKDNAVPVPSTVPAPASEKPGEVKNKTVPEKR